MSKPNPKGREKYSGLVVSGEIGVLLVGVGTGVRLKAADRSSIPGLRCPFPAAGVPPKNI